MQAYAPSTWPRNDSPHLIARFEAFIAAAEFPCVGAKSALARGQMHFLIEDDMTLGPRQETLAALQQFSSSYSATSPLFQSVVLLFCRAPVLPRAELPRAGLTEATSPEVAFESQLCAYLQRLHDADVQRHAWDPHVSKDAESANFSFSVGGRGYYVVGLHPDASRAARRFSHPALVFNLHDQFERLRERGTYGTLRDAIVARDIALEGDRNPMLKQFGTVSEARQYSGRVVEDSWTCPFHAR